MLKPYILAIRVGAAIIGLLLLLLWAVCVTEDYWLWALGLFWTTFCMATGRVTGALMFLIDTVRALFAEPSSPEYERTVDGVREAARNIHCWVSRNVAAAIGCGTILALWIAPEPLELAVGLVGFVAIPTATHWPAITRRLREWGKTLEAAE